MNPSYTHNWLPLDTAPRDGTHILFFYGSCRGVFTAWYSREIEWQTGNQTGYSTWHLREPDSTMSAVYFEEENPANCYWQPMMELPV